MEDKQVSIVESKTSKFYQIKPIKKILLSDPLYTNDIADRYEREEVYCDVIHFEYSRYHYSDEIEVEELTLSLFTEYHYEKAMAIKEYELGIDSAKIMIGFNDECETIQTGGDGQFGVVKEFYSNKGNIVAIKISMNVPDFRINFEEFLEMIRTQIGIHSDIEWVNQEDINQVNEQKQI